MALQINKLTALKVKNETHPGRHSDGNGLYLNVTKSGAKSWVFLYKRHGRRREMGLGSARVVSLSEARDIALEAQKKIRAGQDPLSHKETAKPKTFGDCADAYIAAMEPSWRNEKHRAQWRMTLTKYVEDMRSLPVSEIDTDDILAVLQPIWQSKPETAYRLMGRIERVLSAARTQGFREGQNPAQWKGHLEHLLPCRTKLSRGHHRAMPYKDVPEFMSCLQARNGMAAIALEFLILTASRSGEVRFATWDEVSLVDKVWTIPASRMKAGRQHIVPLTMRAIELLNEARELAECKYMFPGPTAGNALSENAMTALLKRMEVPNTVHGYRSSFRDWTADCTDFPNEVCEMALAHTIKSQTERAYRRGNLLDKRRKLMEQWEQYCRAMVV